VIVTVVALKVAVQPWLHNCLIEIKVVEPRDGEIWAWHAADGSWGKKISAMWVDCIVRWSGRDTESGVMAGGLLMYGAVMDRK
jgi:hypothetical protein